MDPNRLEFDPVEKLGVNRRSAGLTAPKNLYSSKVARTPTCLKRAL